jgi:hypothetical protein
VTFEQLIEQQQPTIDQIVRDLARRHYLAPPEIEEFRAAVEGALERNDFELLRAFDGRSTWATYLGFVLTREFFAFRNALWGHWRPSAAAQRLGPAAMLLEELVVRDRFALADAIDCMRANHRVDLPRHRLVQFADRLGLYAPATASAPAETAVDARVRGAMAAALAVISPDDRLILELRFRDRQPLTRIAKLLNIDVRPIQRRLENATQGIRQSLLAHGVAAEQVEALLRQAEHDSSHPQHRWWDSVLLRPSN